MAVSQVEDVRKAPSADFRTPWGEAKPNADLPGKVNAADGVVTIFADFASANDEGIPIYIVNRTRTPLVLPAQDGALFLKLAVKSDGGWQRAQSHSFSWCGNSYHTRALPGGQYIESVGYRPKSGQEGTVRFQIGGSEPSLVSNEGPGWWNAGDVADSAVDQMAEQTEPAIMMFRGDEDGGMPVDACLIQLKLLKSWSDGPMTQMRIQRFRAELLKLKARDAGRAGDAISKLEEISSVKGSPVRSHRRLLDACVATLRETGKDGTVAHGGNYPWVAWELLNWVSRTPEGPPLDAWKEVFWQLQDRLPAADPEESRMIARFLRSNPLVHEYLSSDFLEAAAIKHPLLRESCAERLANRSEWSRLVAIGNQLDERSLPVIFGYYCVDPLSSGSDRMIRLSSPDAFMEKCIRSSPWECFNQMHLATGYRERMYLEPGLSLLYREIFENFLKEAQENPFPISNSSEMSGLMQYVRSFQEQGGVSPRAKKQLERVSELGSAHIQRENEPQKKWRQQIKVLADHILVR